jgi:broad specificity phosphatase PhoE/Ca2+-binding EF-hand superfamily protein
MSLRKWLADNSLLAHAPALVDLDVISVSDLGVRIFWEESNGTLSVPEEIRSKYKATENQDKWSGAHLEDLQKAFGKFSSGSSMTMASLSDSFVTLGQSFSYEEVKKILSDIDGFKEEKTEEKDEKKDEQISFVEFCRVIRARTNGYKPVTLTDSLQRLFDHYDRDQSGFLDLKEVTKLLNNLGLKDVDPKTLIEQSDKDGNNLIDKNEFLKALEEQTEQSHWKVLKYWLLLSSGWAPSEKSPDKVTFSPDEKIISFIRHGESEANAACEGPKGTAKGIFNPHITAKGVAQAQGRRAKLKEDPERWKFDLIVVSPMKRTLETYKEALADYIDKVPTIGHPLVREQFSESDDVGDAPSVIKPLWPNIDWSAFPDQPEVWWYPGPDFTQDQIPSLTVQSQRDLNLKDDWEEPWGDVLVRASQFEDWLRGRPEKHICVVSHGGFIEALVGPRMGNAEHCILRV